jgi:hypothetical protein
MSDYSISESGLPPAFPESPNVEQPQPSAPSPEPAPPSVHSQPPATSDQPPVPPPATSQPEPTSPPPQPTDPNAQPPTPPTAFAHHEFNCPTCFANLQLTVEDNATITEVISDLTHEDHISEVLHDQSAANSFVPVVPPTFLDATDRIIVSSERELLSYVRNMFVPTISFQGTFPVNHSSFIVDEDNSDAASTASTAIDQRRANTYARLLADTESPFTAPLNVALPENVSPFDPAHAAPPPPPRRPRATGPSPYDNVPLDVDRSIIRSFEKDDKVEQTFTKLKTLISFCKSTTITDKQIDTLCTNLMVCYDLCTVPHTVDAVKICNMMESPYKEFTISMVLHHSLPNDNRRAHYVNELHLCQGHRPCHVGINDLLRPKNRAALVEFTEQFAVLFVKAALVATFSSNYAKSLLEPLDPEQKQRILATLTF